MMSLGMLAVFIVVMWALMILGGGILVLLVAPISMECCGEYDPLVSSVIKAAITLLLVAVWILILSYMKKLIMRRLVGSTGH